MTEDFIITAFKVKTRIILKPHFHSKTDLNLKSRGKPEGFYSPPR